MSCAQLDLGHDLKDCGTEFEGKHHILLLSYVFMFKDIKQNMSQIVYIEFVTCLLHLNCVEKISESTESQRGREYHITCFLDDTIYKVTEVIAGLWK